MKDDELGTDQADDGRESGMHFWDAALYASGQVMQKNVNEPCILQSMTCNQCWLEWLKKEADCSDGADGSKSKED